MPQPGTGEACPDARTRRVLASRVAGKGRLGRLEPQDVYPQLGLDLRHKNSMDFRGPASEPGSKGQYAVVAIHAGLICLNAPEDMDLDLQLELFELPLDELVRRDLINQLLEVTLVEGDEIRVLRYALPLE